MHTGKIKKIVKDRGFGFIADTDGREVFFHRNNLVDNSFESLVGDEKVEFDVENGRKGPNAINISVTAISDDDKW